MDFNRWQLGLQGKTTYTFTMEDGHKVKGADLFITRIGLDA